MRAVRLGKVRPGLVSDGRACGGGPGGPGQSSEVDQVRGSARSHRRRAGKTGHSTSSRSRGSQPGGLSSPSLSSPILDSRATAPVCPTTETRQSTFKPRRTCTAPTPTSPAPASRACPQRTLALSRTPRLTGSPLSHDCHHVSLDARRAQAVLGSKGQAHGRLSPRRTRLSSRVVRERRTDGDCGGFLEACPNPYKEHSRRPRRSTSPPDSPDPVGRLVRRERVDSEQSPVERPPASPSQARQLEPGVRTAQDVRLQPSPRPALWCR